MIEVMIAKPDHAAAHVCVKLDSVRVGVNQAPWPIRLRLLRDANAGPIAGLAPRNRRSNVCARSTFGA